METSSRHLPNDHSEIPRRRTPSHRPRKYSLRHQPRRVVRAEGDGVAELPARRRAARSTGGVRRFKIGRKSLTVWEWAGCALSLVASALLVREIVMVQDDYRQIRSSVHEKQAQFDALDKQKVEEQNRLAHLRSERGREQLLAERGYLRPGDRILLFPKEAPKATE